MKTDAKGLRMPNVNTTPVGAASSREGARPDTQDAPI
jgi:hypothetical protein